MQFLLTIPAEFWLFGLTLAGVALLQNYPLPVAATGLAAILIFKLLVSGFDHGHGWLGLARHMDVEWVSLANLLLLLLGFALLSDQFEQSGIPDAMPALLPDNWLGGAALLAIIFVLSTFLDNIAAALVGGVIARHVYRGNVSIGFLAAIVTASNAGGAGSVIGDTTTTLMWINGVAPERVARAFVASGAALLVVAVLASWLQHRHAPITKHNNAKPRIEWTRAGIVFFILACAVAANIAANAAFPWCQQHLPCIGLAVWAAILLTSPLRAPKFAALGEAGMGAAFLLCLVLAASLMPVHALPLPSWHAALGLGIVSAVFDNIPLTAMTLKQGGYDWGYLAYAVGVGGSIMWFGSSAGVALTAQHPQGRSARGWLLAGWFVPVAYLAGFGVMMLLLGWGPSAPF